MSKDNLSAAEQKTLKAVVKKPRSATEVAERTGHSSHHGVARPLGKLVEAGLVEKTPKGYVKV